MKLMPEETELLGSWVAEDDHVSADTVCDRIAELTERHLTKIATASGGWETLFQDPDDGRYWELTYPQSDLHGGGPPKLKWLSADEAEKKYGSLST